MRYQRNLTGIQLGDILFNRVSRQSVSHSQCLVAADIVLSSIEKESALAQAPLSNDAVTIANATTGPRASRVHISNFWFPVHKLLSLAVLGAFTTASTVADIWLLPFAIILFVQTIAQQTELQLSQTTAYVLYAIARISTKGVEVYRDSIITSVGYLCESYGITIEQRAIDLELINLVQIGILRKSDEGYLVVEKIVVESDVQNTHSSA